MKKVILALTTLAIAGTSVQKASAGGCEWGTAAAVVGGVTAGLVIGGALASRPAYYVAPAPVYYPAPGYGYTYYAPPARPAVVYTAPAPVVYTAPAPVVYATPAPVVVYRARAYAPRPVVSVSFGYCGHRRGCW